MGVTTGIVEFANLNDANQEGPHLARSKKSGSRRRINGQLTLCYQAEGLTSMGCLELIGWFILRLDRRVTLRGVEGAPATKRSWHGSAVNAGPRDADSGPRRVRHVCYLANAPLVERLYGLSWLPSRHTLGGWLRGFDADSV